MKSETADLISNDVETPFLSSSSQGAGQQHPRKKPLTLLPLIALIFFEVSGGPFGTEVSASTMLVHAGRAPRGLDSSHCCAVQITCQAVGSSGWWHAQTQCPSSIMTASPCVYLYFHIQHELEALQHSGS
jgi:hypothetical protein